MRVFKKKEINQFENCNYFYCKNINSRYDS